MGVKLEKGSSDFHPKRTWSYFSGLKPLQNFMKINCQVPVHRAQLMKTSESSAVQPDLDPCFQEIFTSRRDLSYHWRPCRSPRSALRSSHSLSSTLSSSAFPSSSATMSACKGNASDRLTTSPLCASPRAIDVSGICRPIRETVPFCFGTAPVASLRRRRFRLFALLRIRLPDTWFESSEESRSGIRRFLSLVDLRRSCVESATARTASVFKGVACSLVFNDAACSLPRRVNILEFFASTSRTPAVNHRHTEQMDHLVAAYFPKHQTN